MNSSRISFGDKVVVLAADSNRNPRTRTLLLDSFVGRTGQRSQISSTYILNISFQSVGICDRRLVDHVALSAEIGIFKFLSVVHGLAFDVAIHKIFVGQDWIRASMPSGEHLA